MTSLAGIGGKLLSRLNGRSACAGPRGLGAVSPGGSAGEPPPSAPEEVSSTWAAIGNRGDVDGPLAGGINGMDVVMLLDCIGISVN